MSNGNNRVLVLTYRMAKGFGVDVVVANLLSRLRVRGYSTATACIDTDGFYEKQSIFPIGASVASVVTVLEALRPAAVIIHTIPFFELLPEIKKVVSGFAWSKDIKWVIWEHGDPNPEFFGEDRKRRELEKSFKQEFVYPIADELVVISDFVGRDIGYSASKPKKTKIYNGADHAPDRGPKTARALSSPGKALRIGILSRIGRGESFYKGTERFHEVIEALKAKSVSVQGAFMGGGTVEDAKHLIEQGYEVHLNSSDEEKWDFLRGLDVFVSCSRWEGFNLPLVEAQAIGTLSMAFDAGAHREVCHFVFSGVEEMADAIARYSEDRAQLLADSNLVYQNVRKQFTWDRMAGEAEALLIGMGVRPIADGKAAQMELSLFTRSKLFCGRVKHFLVFFGFWGIIRRVIKRMLIKLGTRF
jgi:glycosyltransferase involved in cell wall biosynthesis